VGANASPWPGFMPDSRDRLAGREAAKPEASSSRGDVASGSGEEDNERAIEGEAQRVPGLVPGLVGVEPIGEGICSTAHQQQGGFQQGTPRARSSSPRKVLHIPSLLSLPSGALPAKDLQPTVSRR